MSRLVQAVQECGLYINTDAATIAAIPPQNNLGHLPPYSVTSMWLCIANTNISAIILSVWLNALVYLYNLHVYVFLH